MIYVAEIRDYVVFESNKEIDRFDLTKKYYSEKCKKDGLYTALINVMKVDTINKIPEHLHDDTLYGSSKNKTVRESMKEIKRTTIEIDGDYITVEGKQYKLVQ